MLYCGSTLYNWCLWPILNRCLHKNSVTFSFKSEVFLFVNYYASHTKRLPSISMQCMNCNAYSRFQAIFVFWIGLVSLTTEVFSRKIDSLELFDETMHLGRATKSSSKQLISGKVVKHAAGMSIFNQISVLRNLLEKLSADRTRANFKSILYFSAISWSLWPRTGLTSLYILLNEHRSKNVSA